MGKGQRLAGLGLQPGYGHPPFGAGKTGRVDAPAHGHDETHGFEGLLAIFEKNRMISGPRNWPRYYRYQTQIFASHIIDAKFEFCVKSQSGLWVQTWI